MEGENSEGNPEPTQVDFEGECSGCSWEQSQVEEGRSKGNPECMSE